jgi:hypothetical protein
VDHRSHRSHRGRRGPLGDRPPDRVLDPGQGLRQARDPGLPAEELLLELALTEASALELGLEQLVAMASLFQSLGGIDQLLVPGGEAAAGDEEMLLPAR